MADDTLTPVEVAEIRAEASNNDEGGICAGWRRKAVALCDTVEALREKVTLLEGEVKAVASMEGVANVIDQAVEAKTADLREQLRKAQRGSTESLIEINRLGHEISRLTAAIRDAKPALLRSACMVEEAGDDIRDDEDDAATLRALAEMGVGDG